jgi:hypothetical protein
VRDREIVIFWILKIATNLIILIITDIKIVHKKVYKNWLYHSKFKSACQTSSLKFLSLLCKIIKIRLFSI